MKVDLGIWGKLTWVVTIFAIMAGITLVVGWYLPLINKNEHMRQDILKLSAKIQAEDDLGKQLKASIDAVQHDPKTVERLARKELGYAKPGETVIRFETPATNSAAH
jgi:cell division protein FtsB